MLVHLVSSRRSSSGLSRICGCRGFFFTDWATTDFYTLSLHDALPISLCNVAKWMPGQTLRTPCCGVRSEEHTSELQSLRHLVCRLLLEKKKQELPELRRSFAIRVVPCERPGAGGLPVAGAVLPVLG